MRRLSILFFIVLSSPLPAKAEFTPFWPAFDLVDGSLASREQILELQNAVEGSIDEVNKKVRDFNDINRALQKMNLPLIEDQKPSLKVKMHFSEGFDHAILAGFSADDGRHLYCLPCSIDGNFVLGISVAKKSWWPF